MRTTSSRGRAIPWLANAGDCLISYFGGVQSGQRGAFLLHSSLSSVRQHSVSEQALSDRHLFCRSECYHGKSLRATSS
jgi:hypothetical protein